MSVVESIASPPPAPLRVGLIGCGKMGLQHLRAIATLSNSRIVGIADPALDPATLSGLIPADALLCADPADLLERAKPEVVHIITPPGTHAVLAEQCIDSGCHVYVEKPFTATRAEAQRILARAAQRGVTVCAGHQYLFERPFLLALDAMEHIGSIVHVESYSSFRMVRRTITRVEQVKDILPHAVYPVVQQLGVATGNTSEPIRVVGLDVKADGDVYALLRAGRVTGVVTVTLNGRPVEQFQHIVGTNGWLRADYVSGSLTCLKGPGTGIGALLTPFRRGWQTWTGAAIGVTRLVFRRSTSYPGLQVLIGRFHRSILEGTGSPVAPASILATVDVCEQIGEALDAVEAKTESEAEARLRRQTAELPPLLPGAGTVLVTGGTGMLGRRVARELRDAGYPVRVLGRRMPSWTARVPGVDYVVADLGRPLEAGIVAGAHCIVHCAAETAGGKNEHERNSIQAVRHVAEAAARVGARLIHISSIAVLKPGYQARRALDEASPVDAGNLERGPYVWGKVESEVLAQRLCAELGVPLRIIRPGPLVDFSAFSPPGRLGKELGPLFVAVGGKKSPLSVCDVGTAARVIRSYVHEFETAPPVLNLVEAPAPTRRELARRFKEQRPDLRFLWLPAGLVRLLSGPAKLAQRLMLGSQKPIDVYAAFASEIYRTDLAAAAIARADAAERGDSSQRIQQPA